MFKAIFWDFGGVFTTSPFAAFNDYERQHRLPLDFIRSVNATNPDNNAWAQFERSEISFAEFDQRFLDECQAAGHAIAGNAVIELVFGELRPAMVKALNRCQGRWLNACLTNNMTLGSTGDALDQRHRRTFDQVRTAFDLIVESRTLGVRKPDPRFYHTACQQLAVDPTEVVYLDDLGVNLKPAKAMGISTIKVVTAEQAITELETLLDTSLR